MELGIVLKTIRKKKKLTQGTLAKESGFSRATIAELETGDPNVKLRTLQAISKVLEVPLSTIFKIAEDVEDVEDKIPEVLRTPKARKGFVEDYVESLKFI